MAIFSSADNDRSYYTNFEGSDHEEETISTAESSPEYADDEEIRQHFEDLRKQLSCQTGFVPVHSEEGAVKS